MSTTQTGVDGLLIARTAVVTGGAAGIGGATSRALAGAGAHVILNDIDEDLASAAAAEIGPDSVTLVIGDIRRRSTIDALRDTVVQAGGGLDVLVNNVGDFRPARRNFLETTEDDWQAMYAINLEHVFRCTRALLPVMIDHGGGSIVNVSTVEASRGIPSMPVYSAFNSGVDAFTRSLAVHVGRHGVRVNAIAPDLADTRQTPAEAMLRDRDPALIRCWSPLGRYGQPAEYADVVLFLASDLSRYVTGTTIPVDGGTLAAGGWYGRANGNGWTNMPNSP